jgi:hypothetical protein
VTVAADKATYSWSAAASATRYNVVRGSIGTWGLLSNGSQRTTTIVRETPEVAATCPPLRVIPRGSRQGTGHSGQSAYERAQYANVPLQPMQQTGVVPPQLLQDLAGALAAGARSWAVPITTAKTRNATVTSFLIVELLIRSQWNRLYACTGWSRTTTLVVTHVVRPTALWKLEASAESAARTEHSPLEPMMESTPSESADARSRSSAARTELSALEQTTESTPC